MSPYYNYLGLKISSRGTWSAAINQLSSQAKKGLFKVNGYVKSNAYLDADLKMLLFDSMVTPIMLYGSEIWGADNHSPYEVEHTKFCKQVLGVSYRTSNIKARAELGRYPLQIKALMRVISYWLKIHRTEPARLPCKAYCMLKGFLTEAHNSKNWVSQVRLILNQHGFGLVWWNQGVEDCSLFLKAFKQRCIDINRQESSHSLSSKENDYYMRISDLGSISNYLTQIHIVRHRRGITAIRTASNCLNANIRTNNDTNMARLCRLCNLGCIEDEIHFCLECTAYRDVRESLLPAYYWHHPTMTKFVNLLNNGYKQVILSKLVYICFERRKVMLKKILVNSD